MGIFVMRKISGNHFWDGPCLYMIYPRLLTGFGMLVLFTNFSFMEFQVWYLALFLLFLAIDSFTWFWMESLHKNIKLMLLFLNVQFLVLHFSYYTLMTFLMMLFFKKLGFTPCKAEQQTRGMELQEKGAQKH